MVNTLDLIPLDISVLRLLLEISCTSYYLKLYCIAISAVYTTAYYLLLVAEAT